MLVLHTDGTVISNDLPKAAVEGINDLNTARGAIKEWMDEQGANWALFQYPGTVNDPVRVKFDSPKQAITAATDLLLYGRYDHPLTTAGLHLYNNADLNAMHRENMGAVHASYKGDVVTAPESGWARIGIQMGAMYTKPLTIETAINKHNYVDYLISGYPLQVWIAPIRDFAATFMVQWLLDDVEDAKAYRNERLNAASLRRREIRPAGTDAWRTLQEAQKVGEDVELPTEINAPVNGQKEIVDLMSIEGPVGIGLYKGGAWVTNLTFDRSNPQSVLQADKLLGGEESKYAVEVLS